MFGNYINGEWISTGATFENRNPATGEVVGTFVKGTAADIDAAAAAAPAPFPGRRATTGPARANILYKAADILDKNFESVATDMTREEGKTLPEAKGEVRRAINIFRYFAGEGSRLPGMLVPSERDRVHMFALRKPIGVVGLVTPWNFPSAIPAWKLAPALICGNTVVLKPASAAPLSAWRLVEALHEAGLPKGVVNFVAGCGGNAGAAGWKPRRSRPSPSPAPARSATGCMPKPPNAVCAFNWKWAARIPPSCWPTPTSTPLSRTP